jgi:hypothetical protein
MRLLNSNVTAHDFTVQSINIKCFVPKGTFTSLGQTQPGRVSFAQFLEYKAPSNSSFAVEMTLREDGKNENSVKWTLNPRIVGASTARLEGKASQWDLFIQALFEAGIGYSIKGVTGLIEPDTRKFRATTGNEVSSGYEVYQLIDQDNLEILLSSGKIDKQVFGEKFKFLKGLNAATATIEHLGLASGCYIVEQTFVQEKRDKSGRRTARNAGETQQVVETKEMI